MRSGCVTPIPAGACENWQLASRLVRLAFSPDSKHIATTERDSAVRLYDAETGDRVWSHVVKLTNIYENYTSAIAFSPDGKIAGRVRHRQSHLPLEPSTGEEIAQLERPSLVSVGAGIHVE